MEPEYLEVARRALTSRVTLPLLSKSYRVKVHSCRLSSSTDTSHCSSCMDRHSIVVTHKDYSLSHRPPQILRKDNYSVQESCVLGILATITLSPRGQRQEGLRGLSRVSGKLNLNQWPELPKDEHLGRGFLGPPAGKVEQLEHKGLESWNLSRVSLSTASLYLNFPYYSHKGLESLTAMTQASGPIGQHPLAVIAVSYCPYTGFGRALS